MLAEERQHHILEILLEKGVARTTDLAKMLGVSTETIRKDLDTLATHGHLNKVHGGALLPQKVLGNAGGLSKIYEPFEERYIKNADSKQHIAAVAASLVSEGASIALDDGTSGYAMAGVLREHYQRLTVVTNSLKSATILADKPDFTVILCGGVLMADGHSCVGDLATLILERLTVDVMFITASGISESGLTDQRLDEIRIQQQMINCARKVVVLADSTKFGENSFVWVCGLEDVDVIVTDREPSEELAAVLEEKGCQLIVATGMDWR